MTKQWNNNRPSVGEECEISNSGQPWLWCKIQYMGETLCVVDHKSHNDQYYHLGSVDFRPARSQEEKDNAANNVWILGESYNLADLHDVEKIHDLIATSQVNSARAIAHALLTRACG